MNDQPAVLIPMPSGYADWLVDLKTRIHTAQQRAALAVNREWCCCIGRWAAIFLRGRPSRAGGPR